MDHPRLGFGSTDRASWQLLKVRGSSRDTYHWLFQFDAAEFFVLSLSRLSTIVYFTAYRGTGKLQFGRNVSKRRRVLNVAKKCSNMYRDLGFPFVFRA